VIDLAAAAQLSRSLRSDISNWRLVNRDDHNYVQLTRILEQARTLDDLLHGEVNAS
jgi:hypothetical protein